MNLASLLQQEPGWRPRAVRASLIALRLVPSSAEALLDLGDTLALLGREDAANLTHALGVERGMWQHPQQRPMHLVRGLTARPWWAPSLLPVVRKLTTPSALAVLRSEGLALLEAHSKRSRRRRRLARRRPRATRAAEAAAFLPYHSSAVSSGRWRDVTLAVHGARQPGARQRHTQCAHGSHGALRSPRACGAPHCARPRMVRVLCRRAPRAPQLRALPLARRGRTLDGPRPRISPRMLDASSCTLSDTPRASACVRPVRTPSHAHCMCALCTCVRAHCACALHVQVVGSAYFSLLSPGARLRPHCGPTNARLRVHVPLRVPAEAAAVVGRATHSAHRSHHSVHPTAHSVHSVRTPLRSLCTVRAAGGGDAGGQRDAGLGGGRGAPL